ncbi:MAG: hypothetical protein JO072_15105 [Parafilimonas sp.]|nr:hypothetical protein [Parafilimonas sp.]
MQHTFTRITKLGFIIISIFLFACKKEQVQTEIVSGRDPQNSTTAVPIIMHSATPKQTDSTIGKSGFGNPTQYAYLPKNSNSRQDHLLIIIPGTFGLPSNYDTICMSAAKAGYYAFAVAYDNLIPIEFYNANANDSTIENVLNEYLTGENTSPKVNVTKPNSFENRILKMIRYMDAAYPSENWKRFLSASGKDLQWEKFSVGGHSQGSDHAMFMSRKRNLFRAAFIGGPGSFTKQDGNFPTFMTTPGLTPADRLYGFNHTQDKTRPWSQVQIVWQALGIPGEPNSVDDGSTGSSHRLVTSLAVSDPHLSVVMDNYLPLNSNGVSVYEPVWRSMLYSGQ